MVYLLRTSSHFSFSAWRQWLMDEMNSIGLEVYTQNFSLRHGILFPMETEINGSNIYGIMRSPSTGRTEALLLTVPLSSSCSVNDTDGDSVDKPCFLGGVSSVLSLLRLIRSKPCVNNFTSPFTVRTGALGKGCSCCIPGI